MVDVIEGQVHNLDFGRGDQGEASPEGSVVRIAGRGVSVRDVDQTVAETAESNGGRYSIQAHLRQDPSATQPFAEAHVRRLEAMRRPGADVHRNADGSWSIAPDHLDQTAAYAAQAVRGIAHRSHRWRTAGSTRRRGRWPFRAR